tara:strand:+ start:367 stop:504 length:138 start_codon:yes stop_codon:yes gene_type:complete
MAPMQEMQAYKNAAGAGKTIAKRPRSDHHRAVLAQSKMYHSGWCA